MTVRMFHVNMNPEIDLSDVLMSGYVAQGPRVERFESELGYWMGGRRPVTVNSGTSALTLALRLAGVAGHQVITTPMTCSATNLAILAAGGVPVFADVDARTGLISPDSVSERITSLTAAIMAVDWGGAPCDYDYLTGFGIPVIEDAAHAFGARYRGKQMGGVADYTAFSFQAIKHLTTGDGGALVVPEGQERRARTLRWFGIDREAETKEFRGEVDIPEWGYKFHMNDIAAEIGLQNLPRVGDILWTHRTIAAAYRSDLPEWLECCEPTYDHRSSYWMFTVLLPDEERRDAFKRHMNERGVQCTQVHWRNDELTVFAPYRRHDLHGLEQFSRRMVCLPVNPTVDVARVLEVAWEFRP